MGYRTTRECARERAKPKGLIRADSHLSIQRARESDRSEPPTREEVEEERRWRIKRRQTVAWEKWAKVCLVQRRNIIDCEGAFVANDNFEDIEEIIVDCGRGEKIDRKIDGRVAVTVDLERAGCVMEGRTAGNMTGIPTEPLAPGLKSFLVLL